MRAGVDGDADWALQVVAALRSGGLVCSPTRGPLLSGHDPVLDAATLRPAAGSAGADESPLVPTIVMRRALVTAAAQLDLASPNLETRRAAAAQIDKSFASLDPALVTRALATETDPDIRATLGIALAKRGLESADPAQRQKAIAAVAEVPSEGARTLLTDFLQGHADTLDPASAAAARAALRSINAWLTAGRVCAVLFSGLSYGGVLLITALGLSIVFGLLGVINLAHGEFIMLGAYATYVVEQQMHAHLPGLFDVYIFVAIPVAFAFCGLAGVLLEVCVIRFLYRRPLETLLATWAVSIALVKGVQVVFGSQNVEFITPAFLNGGVRVLRRLLRHLEPGVRDRSGGWPSSPPRMLWSDTRASACWCAPPRSAATPRAAWAWRPSASTGGLRPGRRTGRSGRRGADADHQRQPVDGHELRRRRVHGRRARRRRQPGGHGGVVAVAGRNQPVHRAAVRRGGGQGGGAAADRAHHPAPAARPVRAEDPDLSRCKSLAATLAAPAGPIAFALLLVALAAYLPLANFLIARRHRACTCRCSAST